AASGLKKSRGLRTQRDYCQPSRGSQSLSSCVVSQFDAILFDAGGILVVPDPTVLGPLLSPYGGDPSIERHVRAHYRAMAVKSWAGSTDHFWDEYNVAYVESIGVPAE